MPGSAKAAQVKRARLLDFSLSFISVSALVSIFKVIDKACYNYLLPFLIATAAAAAAAISAGSCFFAECSMLAQAKFKRISR
jgi:hypothetical protein